MFKPYLHEIEGVVFSDSLSIIACGSSLNAALYTQHFFKVFRTFKKVVCLDAAEIILEDLPEN